MLLSLLILEVAWFESGTPWTMMTRVPMHSLSELRSLIGGGGGGGGGRGGGGEIIVQKK
jgi:hypothetical protein